MMAVSYCKLIQAVTLLEVARLDVLSLLVQINRLWYMI